MLKINYICIIVAVFVYSNVYGVVKYIPAEPSIQIIIEKNATLVIDKLQKDKLYNCNFSEPEKGTPIVISVVPSDYGMRWDPQTDGGLRLPEYIQINTCGMTNEHGSFSLELELHNVEKMKLNVQCGLVY